MKRRISCLLCLVLTALLLSGCASQGGAINVGIAAAGLPASVQTRNGFDGFEVELWQRIGLRLGREVRFHAMGENEGIAAVGDKRLDAYCGARDSRGAPGVTLLGPYRNEHLVAVVAEGSRLSEPGDLEGCRIAVAEGGEAAAWLAANPSVKSGFGSTVYVEDMYSALLDIMVADYDAALLDRSEAAWQILRGSMKLTCMAESLDGEGTPLYFAMQADHTLYGHVAQALYEMALEGELSELSQKWFGQELLPSAEELAAAFGLIMTEETPSVGGESAES